MLAASRLSNASLCDSGLSSTTSGRDSRSSSHTLHTETGTRSAMESHGRSDSSLHTTDPPVDFVNELEGVTDKLVRVFTRNANLDPSKWKWVKINNPS